MDLHLHTPASVDFQQTGVTVLDILKKAEERGLDLIAFTDHNSVRGYADLWREIEDLELLEHLGRINANESARLAEYRRLLDRVRLLPGFEFTATFGFHILAIFPETTSIRLMEHLLLTLGVPEDRFGSGEVGSTSDVLRAYEILDENGAIVIGAHVNSSHGVAMQGLKFGGQTKIAYTQDEHLAALEVTDLGSSSRRSTAYFFNGTKTEYPRRMHAIQGSDAHRLDRDPNRESNLGVGDRVTEIQLESVSFASLKELLRSSHFNRIRPARVGGPAADELHAAREEGPNATRAFHERVSLVRTGTLHVVRDAVSMANGEGGVIYLGVGTADRRTVPGVPNATDAVGELLAGMKQEIEPPLDAEASIINYDGKSVIALQVPAGPDVPYALHNGGILIRQGAESVNANRNQIVALVRGRTATPVVQPLIERTSAERSPEPMRVERRPVLTAPVSPASARPSFSQPVSQTPVFSRPASPVVASEQRSLAVIAQPNLRVEALPAVIEPDSTNDAPVSSDPLAPKNGVEIIGQREIDGVAVYTLRDLRNGMISEDVPGDTSRKLWRYAIQQREQRTVDHGHIRWKGDFGFWKTYRPHRGERRYNLALRDGDDVRLFYGVSEDGLTEQWRKVIPPPRTTPMPTDTAEPSAE